MPSRASIQRAVRAGLTEKTDSEHPFRCVDCPTGKHPSRVGQTVAYEEGEGKGARGVPKHEQGQKKAPPPPSVSFTWRGGGVLVE